MSGPTSISKRAGDVDAALAKARAFVAGARPEGSPEDALKRARAFLALVRGEDDLEKSLWGSPAGKRHLAKRIVAAIPKHRVYVEPFAGGAQVFWAKEPSEVEVLADRDPDIAFAFRFVKGLTPKKLERLKRKSWVGDAERFKKLYESKPEDDVERFYRFAYLAHFSFNKLRRGTMPDKHIGVEARFIERLERFAPRLKKVVVRCADYEDVVEEFDAPDAFFFLDPPYPGYEAEVGHDDWDERRFGKVLRRIDGKFLVTYGTRSERTDELFKGFHVERWRHTSGVGAHQGQGLKKSVTLVATNYRLQKSAEPEERQMLLPNIAGPLPVEKTIWGSPAGKKRLAARLVKLIPPHKVYVEPFAGSAAVFFEKEPVETEVLGDADPDIAAAFKAIKSLTDGELEALREKSWIGSERTFKQLLDARPRSKVDKLYRFLYLSHFSYGKLRGKSFNPNATGVEARTIERIEQHRDRLRAATIRHAHYADLVKELDGPDTFFFLDPPYPGHNVEIGEDTFDEVEFRKVLDGIKGRFLVTYGTRGRLDTKGFHVRKIRPPRSIRAMRGVGGPKTLPQLLIANYAITEKALGAGDDAWALDEVLDIIDVEGQADATVPDVVAARALDLASGKVIDVALFDPNQPRDEGGRFAETGDGSIPATPAARGRIERAAEAVKDVRVSDVRERYSRLQRGSEPVHNEQLVDAHEKFSSSWRYRTDDVNGLAGKVLAGTATDRERATFRERIGDNAEEYLAERYALTQRMLRDRGISEVTVYRGVRGEQAQAIRAALDSGAEHIELDTRSISSFSESRKAASEFGDVVINLSVPVERVFAHHAVERQFAKGGEKEVVLWNPEGKLRVDRRSIRLKARARGVGPIDIDAGDSGNWLRLWSGELNPDEAPSAKAQWSRAYVNDLPDSAFLYVEPGGEKDDQGKTVPRSLRHFPVRNHLGELDVPHLRNALARIPQGTAPGLNAERRRELQEEARRLLEEATSEVEKARLIPFQQWGGSAKYARRLVERLPEHKRYVEPFCGAAAVFFAKPRAPEEVLADADSEVIFALKYIQKLDARSLAELKRFSWRVSRAGFERAKAAEPGSDAERFWKHVYGRLCTWGAKPNMSGFATIHDGQTYDLEDLWRFHERLAGVRLVTQDWKKTLAECDGPGTLFFMDPPYEAEWAMGDGVPAEDIAKAVSKLKGDFVIAYTDSANARRALAKVGRPFTMRIPEGRGAGQWQKRSRLFVASFKVDKADVEWLDAEPPSLAPALQKRIPLLKTTEERYVLGVVLEPENIDAQKDIYSAAEVREAAHRFMEDYRNLGLMHRELLGDQVKILESYLAPTDFQVDGKSVKKGTWLLAVRVTDDQLWKQIKAGELTGFSIGGSAVKVPEA